ncbi:MAG: sigma-54-dependent Fis family transcriptional regulator, partial [Deltaproteobacteria bacterium]|nr:sigma-54-dependent Fis family transcriptional regulator [Deltaproteobacteria bacterium]
VLVSGESGTGKELLARYVHYKSPRSNKRFVPVNCAAISAGLVESELFGHEKGAFTSADKNKIGKFEFASGGTLFLDEIGDLPFEAQAKFLRALQEKTIQRVGGNDEIDVDVRVICATNQNLPELVEVGKFRQDLYFRINVFPVNPPPLRERKTDVIPLALHFLRKTVQGDQIPEITEGAKKALCAYNWPGNVRELANALERSVILAGGNGKITADTLSFLKTTPVSCDTVSDLQIPPEGLSLEAVQKNLVRQALTAASNNQTAAARLLGLSRAKFRVLMKQIDDA